MAVRTEGKDIKSVKLTNSMFVIISFTSVISLVLSIFVEFFFLILLNFIYLFDMVVRYSSMPLRVPYLDNIVAVEGSDSVLPTCSRDGTEGGGGGGMDSSPNCKSRASFRKISAFWHNA